MKKVKQTIEQTVEIDAEVKSLRFGFSKGELDWVQLVMEKTGGHMPYKHTFHKGSDEFEASVGDLDLSEVLEDCLAQAYPGATVEDVPILAPVAEEVEEKDLTPPDPED